MGEVLAQRDVLPVELRRLDVQPIEQLVEVLLQAALNLLDFVVVLSGVVAVGVGAPHASRLACT